MHGFDLRDLLRSLSTIFVVGVAMVRSQRVSFIGTLGELLAGGLNLQNYSRGTLFSLIDI